MKTDCLIIGFNDSSFDEYVEMVRSMGPASGAYRDLDLTFIEHEGRRLRSMDVLNLFYGQDKGGTHKAFHNADFLWPVVLYLCSYLDRRGFSHDYVNLFHLEKDKLRDKLLHDDILTVAITTTLYVSAHPILEIVSFIRQHNEKVRIVVGGPYIKNQTSMMDAEALQRLFEYLGADFYVINQEGEASLADLLAALKAGADLARVPNLAYRDEGQGGRFAVTGCTLEGNTLEENRVDYRLFPRGEVGELISLRTAKSCPFACSFCGFPQRAGKYTYVDVALVEEELETLHELGVTTLTFLDDTFNVPKKRFQEILRMMAERGWGFRWNSFYRSDHGDAETIELMARAGCEGVFLGVESGSDAMLKRMNKTSRRHNYLAAIPLLQAAGISCHTNLIIGFPGETCDTVAESISLVEEAKPDFYRAQLWYADPVTPIWKQREEYGVTGEAFNWAHHTMDYQTACDLVDRMFLVVQGSTWLPQYGFEQWSTFYLQRKGMTLAQIKRFVRCFNAAVKEKLIHPWDRQVSPEVLRALEESARFDRPVEPDLTPIELLGGNGYKEAERYWGRELGGAAPSGLGLEGAGAAGSGGERLAHRCPVDEATLARLGAATGDLAAPLLAAWAAVLSRLAGREEALVVTAVGGGEGWRAAPVRLAVPWSLGFGELARRVGEQAADALAHRLYAFALATNPWRMAVLGGEPPALEAGFVSTEGLEEHPGQGLEEALAAWPDVDRGLRLCLAVSGASGATRLHLVYRRGDLRSDTVEQLARTLGAFLSAVAGDPGTVVGEVHLGGGQAAARPEIEADAHEAFTF
jgi:radical SAM PhpK family P-methyltransferase